MNILLTGAAGFTGFHFKQLAESVGHTVIPFEADLRDPVATRAAVAAAPCDTVVHLAAISFVGHADSAAFYAVRLELLHTCCFPQFDGHSRPGNWSIPLAWSAALAAALTFKLAC